MSDTRRKRGTGTGRTAAMRSKAAPRKARQVMALDAAPPAGAAKSATTKTAAKKKPAAKRTTVKKTTAKKASAKKPAVKKTTAKKAPAKKSAANAKSARKKTAAQLPPEKAKLKKELEKQIAQLSREVDKAEQEAKKALKATEKRYMVVLKQLKADRARLRAWRNWQSRVKVPSTRSRQVSRVPIRNCRRRYCAPMGTSARVGPGTDRKRRGARKVPRLFVARLFAIRAGRSLHHTRDIQNGRRQNQ